MFRSHFLRTFTTSRRTLRFLATSPPSTPWFSPKPTSPPPERDRVPFTSATSTRWFSAESESPALERVEFSSPLPKSAALEREKVTGGGMSLSEAKKLMRLVNVEALKDKLLEEGKEVICYSELLKVCESFGVARSIDEAKEFARALDDAGVVLLFRDKVYLHPDKVVDLVRRSVPLALTPEDDPRREELKKLQERKEEIDKQAHKEVQVILWLGLGVTVSLVGLFFRLTFWEFSWDVMEPIAFFTTTTGIVIGYTYFMFTAKDPSYQDFMQTMFLSRQRKLMKRYKFDVDRYQELREKCKTLI